MSGEGFLLAKLNFPLDVVVTSIVQQVTSIVGIRLYITPTLEGSNLIILSLRQSRISKRNNNLIISTVSKLTVHSLNGLQFQIIPSIEIESILSTRSTSKNLLRIINNSTISSTITYIILTCIEEYYSINIVEIVAIQAIDGELILHKGRTDVINELIVSILLTDNLNVCVGLITISSSRSNLLAGLREPVALNTIIIAELTCRINNIVNHYLYPNNRQFRMISIRSEFHPSSVILRVIGFAILIECLSNLSLSELPNKLRTCAILMDITLCSIGITILLILLIQSKSKITIPSVVSKAT